MCGGELSGQALYNSNDKHLCGRDVGAPLTIKEDTDNSNFPSAYSPDMRYTKQLKENICANSTLKVNLIQIHPCWYHSGIPLPYMA